MQAKYKFNDTEILYPLSWDETYETVENTGQSEAGTDLVNVVRYGKLSVSCSFRVTNTWLATFKSFMALDSFTLSIHVGWTDAEEPEPVYETHTVRMRDFAQSRMTKSEDLEITIGIWDISFTLEEF